MMQEVYNSTQMNTDLTDKRGGYILMATISETLSNQRVAASKLKSLSSVELCLISVYPRALSPFAGSASSAVNNLRIT